MLAHTLGNPFDLKTVKEFCDRHHLWLVEDNCDALGSTYTIDGETRQTGSIGDMNLQLLSATSYDDGRGRRIFIQTTHSFIASCVPFVTGAVTAGVHRGMMIPVITVSMDSMVNFRRATITSMSTVTSATI